MNGWIWLDNALTMFWDLNTWEYDIIHSSGTWFNSLNIFSPRALRQMCADALEPRSTLESTEHNRELMQSLWHTDNIVYFRLLLLLSMASFILSLCCKRQQRHLDAQLSNDHKCTHVKTAQTRQLIHKYVICAYEDINNLKYTSRTLDAYNEMKWCDIVRLYTFISRNNTRVRAIMIIIIILSLFNRKIELIVL